MAVRGRFPFLSALYGWPSSHAQASGDSTSRSSAATTTSFSVALRAKDDGFLPLNRFAPLAEVLAYRRRALRKPETSEHWSTARFMLGENITSGKRRESNQVK